MNKFSEPNDFSFIDLVQFFRESWKLIILGGTVSGLLGACFVLLETPKYFGVAYIQLARVLNSDIEAPSVFFEKMKTNSFFSTKSIVACGFEHSPDSNIELFKGLQPKLNAKALFIEVSFKAKSNDLVLKCLENVLSEIQEFQSPLFLQLLENKRKQLANLKQQLDLSEQQLKELSLSRSNLTNSDPSIFHASTLLLSALTAKEVEVRDLRSQVINLDFGLTDSQSKQAHFALPIYAPKNPVAPKLMLIALGSYIGGVILAIMFLTVRRSLRNNYFGSKD